MSRTSRADPGLGGSEADPCHSETPNAIPTAATPSTPMSGDSWHAACGQGRDDAESDERQHGCRRAVRSPVVTTVRLARLDDPRVLEREAGGTGDAARSRGALANC